MSIQEEMKRKKKKTTKETKKVTFEEFKRGILGDIDPAKYAGEGFYAVEEYARPDDILSPWVRGDVKNYGDYYPGPDVRRKRK